jgi:phosphoserine aminotransferase
MLYSVIDSSDGYYKSPVAKADRSRMNIVFTLKGKSRFHAFNFLCKLTIFILEGGEALEKQFAKEATQLGLIGLEGHRSVGGLRASLYNATPLEHVQKLAEFMKEFQKRNSN